MILTTNDTKALTINGIEAPAHDRILLNVDKLVIYNKAVDANTDEAVMQWVGAQGEERLVIRVSTTGGSPAIDAATNTWLTVGAARLAVLAIDGDTSKAGSKLISNIVYIIDRDTLGGPDRADVYAMEELAGGRKKIVHYLIDVATVLSTQLGGTDSGTGTMA